MQTKRFTLIATAAALALTAFGSAMAQDFPSKDKPITFVVPFAAGGPTDKAARDLAPPS
jgi:tripartite-type tricarboxylate transporter receptor subunit TctC